MDRRDTNRGSLILDAKVLPKILKSTDWSKMFSAKFHWKFMGRFCLIVFKINESQRVKWSLTYTWSEFIRDHQRRRWNGSVRFHSQRALGWMNISVTRWLHYSFNVWPFTAVKISPIAKMCQSRTRTSLFSVTILQFVHCSVQLVSR